MNILVTGGAGFIGSHLCERLVASGHRVVCLDNFHSFYDPQIKRTNLAGIIDHPDFRLVEGDVRDINDLDKCFSEHEIGLIVHLAAMAGVRPSILEPELYAEVNIMGTHKVLLACQQHGVKRLVSASSSSVYGSKQGGAFRENDDLGKPESPYAETKRAGEVLAQLWQRELGISVVCLRFFTVYGPRQRPDLAIHKFASLLYGGKPLPVFGDGSTCRDYTYIDDTIDGVMGAVEYVQTHSGYAVFNLGEARPVQLLDMIYELEAASGRQAALQWHPLQPGDVPYTCADLTRSRAELNYDPKWTFREGLRSFIRWFEDTRQT